MERAVAVKKLSKMLGKGFSYEINSKAPTPEERAAAKAEMPDAQAEHSKLEAKLNERRMAILAADAEYQGILAELKISKDRKAKLSSMLYSHRFTVGNVDRVGGLGFFHVKAQGDSWEEIFQKLETSRR